MTKRRAMFGIFAIIVMVGSLMFLVYYSLGNATTSGSAANLGDAPLPSELRSLPLDGKVDYAIVQQTRGTTYFLAGHMSGNNLQTFCTTLGIGRFDTSPGIFDNDPVLEANGAIVKDTFRLRCASAGYGFEGPCKGRSDLIVRFSFCRELDRVVIRATYLRTAGGK